MSDGGGDRNARLKVKFDNADPIVRGGLDMLDVIDRGGQRAFLRINDALLNVARAQSGVAPNNADNRDVNRRKDIRRCANQDKRRY